MRSTPEKRERATGAARLHTLSASGAADGSCRAGLHDIPAQRALIVRIGEIDHPLGETTVLKPEQDWTFAYY
jgi:hypothetical protein